MWVMVGYLLTLQLQGFCDTIVYIYSNKEMLSQQPKLLLLGMLVLSPFSWFLAVPKWLYQRYHEPDDGQESDDDIPLMASGQL